eukprot:TRINITY_DN4014_c0_g3_i2.p1 TRINITY_DN4014_c0_g3~~TRINITY_DN4014_c0_g3_i2.p1  ORF type:complete len:132 (+),score=9.81 TRINITY_DN4014_c0_g3_i2:367-762(+)
MVLVQHGADVNATGLYCRTPLHLASQEGNPETVKLLLESGADVNVACSMLQAAITHKADSPLHVAAWYNHLEAAKLLVQHWADVNAKDNSSYTPLHCAASNGHVEFIRFLIQSGARVNTKGMYGMCWPKVA